MARAARRERPSRQRPALRTVPRIPAPDGARVAAGLLLLALTAAGCGLAARDHACWPFVARQYQGKVPGDLTRTLARERGTKKEVGHQRAPIGYYWRKRQTPNLDVTEIRTLTRGYELAACPRAAVVPTGAGLQTPR